MGTKIALAAALLVALISLAAATTYTTTVITTSDDETNQGRYQQCRQQLQGRQFRACQRYLSQRGGGYGGRESEEDMEVLENQQQEQLRECCQQLRNVNEQCRCEAIRHAVRQLQQEGGARGQQMQEVYERVSHLPRRCNLRPQRCEVRAVFV